MRNSKSSISLKQKDTAIVVVNLLVDMIECAKPFPMPPEYSSILQNTVNFVRSARMAGFPIIFVRDQHRPGDKEFTDFSAGQSHCIRGSEGADLIPQLQPLGEDDYMVGKRRFSAFFGTDMDLYLREEGIRRLVIVGRPTNVCALYSAADAFLRCYEVVAISDCLYSKTREMHERALQEFADTLGPVMTSTEFLKMAREPKAKPSTEQVRLAVLVVNVNKDLVDHNLPENGTRLASCLESIEMLLHLARKKGFPVIYAMDAHLSDDWEFRTRKPHGIVGTEGAEVADKIGPHDGDTILVKRSYDAFYETGLDHWLRKKGISGLVVVGGPTNVDLRHTVISAYNYRYAPIVIKDCTDAKTEELAVGSLQDMFFCRRMTLDKFTAWCETK